MKKVIAKRYKFESKLGEANFRNVPVWVGTDSGLTSTSFNQNRHEHELSGDVIQLLSREIAVGFYSQFNENRSLTADELYGIQCIFGIKQTDLAKLLGVTKGTISKIIGGSLKMKRPETLLCLEMLKNELLQPGYVRARLEHRQESLPEAHLEPTYDFKKLAKKVA